MYNCVLKIIKDIGEMPGKLKNMVKRTSSSDKLSQDSMINNDESCKKVMIKYTEFIYESDSDESELDKMDKTNSNWGWWHYLDVESSLK